MAIINTNINALAAKQAMALTQRDMNASTQQLATGKRINSAADDAAGLAISNKLSSRIVSLDMAVRNANDGISFLQTADGAAGVLTDMLIRMRELAVQSGNDTYTSTDRTALQSEVAALQSQVGAVLENTEWNGIKLLKGQAGTSGSVKFHVGAATGDAITLSMTTLDTSYLSSAQSTSSVDVSTRSGANSAIAVIDNAVAQVDQARSLWGATANRLAHAADNAANISMNSQASRSAILDADYAKATADLARSLIMEEAGAAMLSQANQQPYYVLALLR